MKLAIRFEILRRDGFRCFYCGSDPQDGVKLHVDHIIAKSKGGSDLAENLITACYDCNIGKRDSREVAKARLHVRWSRLRRNLDLIKIWRGEHEPDRVSDDICKVLSALLPDPIDVPCHLWLERLAWLATEDGVERGGELFTDFMVEHDRLEAEAA